MFSRLLGSRLWSQTSQRAVSSKYQRPKPRSYRRRWFEAAVQPVLPREVKVCTPPGLLHQENVQKGKGYDDFELALAKHVKGWMQKEQFRVLAVCQLLPVQGRTLWFTKNQWRLKGVEYKNYGGKIMRKVFEGTPMDSTDVLFTGYTACLFGRDFATLKTIMSETNKVNWLVPLGFFIDGKLLSCADVKELCELSNLETLRALTTTSLTGPSIALTTTLDRLTNELPSTLNSLETSLKNS